MFLSYRKAKFLVLLIAFVFIYKNSISQNISGIINSYAAVNAINGNTLTVSTTVGFAIGDKVMLIQMQGAAINNANNATFGNITGYNSAGLYEFNYICDINGLNVTLACAVQNVYSTSDRVQLVTVPIYANPVVNAPLTCQAWNGTTGGVLAFDATNVLTFNSDINVDGLGFRGGAFQSGGFCCSSGNFAVALPQGGQKGESIAAYTAALSAQKAKNAGGGGGSSCSNSGGGGGGNGGGGGIGGNQYNGCGAGDQGQAGLALASSIGRMFMGSGGGGGFRDNGQPCSNGGNGGAIVFINAAQINGNGRFIYTRGQDVTTLTRDEGSGGGGAGGSVYINCPNYASAITVNTTGGFGGSNNNTIFTGNCHGPGGGGGGGVFCHSGAAFPGMVTHINAGGAPGTVQNPVSACFNTSWGAAAGSAGVNINNLVINYQTPTITVVGQPTVCESNSVVLTATGTCNYTWSTTENTSSISVSPTAPTIYTVVGGLYTCTNVASYTVSPVPLPTINVVGNFTVCSGQPTTLTVSGATTYSWNTGPVTNTVVVSPLVTTIYTVTGSNSTCSATLTPTVTALALPVPTITTNSPVCALQPITLNGSGGNSYAWAGPSFFNSVSQNTTIPVASTVNAGVYTLTVIDGNNCTNSVTANVIVNPLPIVSASGSTVCANTTVTLSATGGTAYVWGGPLSYTSNVQNPSITNAASSMSGQYMVIVTDGNGCVNSTVTTVQVNDAPIPVALVNDNPICAEQKLNLNSDGGVSYQWFGPAGFNSSLQNPFIDSVRVINSGNYSVTVSDAIGCASVAVISLTVNPLPDISILASPNKGCAPLCVNFTATSNPPIQVCNWNFLDGFFAVNTATPSHCFNKGGLYSVRATVTDVNNCTNFKNYLIDAYPKPVADFNYHPVKPIINDDGDVTFIDASYGAKVVMWDWYFFNLPKPHSNLQNPVYVFKDAGNYETALVVKSDKGCSDTIVKKIVVSEDYGIYVPNTFTPNGDGVNDVFQPKGYGVVKYEMVILDRWGKKVFTTSNFSEGWDGSYKGKGSNKIMDGVYIWQINLTNAQGKSYELTGHVTLMK